MGIIAKYNKLKESHTARWVFSLVTVLVAMGIVGLTKVPEVTGKAINLDPEDVEILIGSILRILEVVLGYLLGRKTRSVFKV